jgi:dihydrofolate reductase
MSRIVVSEFLSLDGVMETPEMNSMPKYVVTTSTEKLAWNNSRLVQGDLAAALSRLKQQPGRDILVAGSGVLVQALMQQHLIDEYRLLVYPIVLGKGKRLFKDGATAGLRLGETKTFDTGVVLLRYAPAAK